MSVSPPEPETVSFAELAGLPFPRQITAIDAYVARGRPAELAPLLEALAELPDHEPLAHTVRSLALARLLDRAPLPEVLERVLASLPDTGVGRVLRGLDRAIVPPEALDVVAGAVAAVVERAGLERIAAFCLMDRWLKNAARGRQQALRAAALEACRAALARGAPREVGDGTLLEIAGAELGGLAELAAESGCLPGWTARLGSFAEQVLEVLRGAPRSLSQANAEEILARRVYTDPGHFLVELLQNAEDAGARTFRVEVSDDEARVWHDGAPFDARDVVGVLSIGQTTKSREQIGFFGVGFKSVYEVCERPQVYSELFAFEIADISIPRPLATRPPGPADGRGTLIVLPFRRPRRPEHAPEALWERVLAVPPETLLTLSSLRRIEAHFGERSRTVARLAADHGEGEVTLELVERGERRRHLVARASFTYDGPRRELSRATRTAALVAVVLDDAGFPTPVGEDAPTVFSHLPTGERSGLRFLVHAHFDLPVDRERLNLESAWNRWALSRAGVLLGRIAARLAEAEDAAALEALLDVLPLPGELRHPAYRVVVDALAAEVADTALLPASGGGRLRPGEARVVDDGALAEALAGATVDAEGRRACAPLESRRRAVARSLGAASFGAGDLLALLDATLAETADGEPWPASWLATGIGAVLEHLGAHPEALPVDRLAALPILPDQRGRARSPGNLRRTGPEIRALYGDARPFLADWLDHRPLPGQARLLEALGVARHGAAEVLADLEDEGLRQALLEGAGPLRLHGWLATLPSEQRADLGELPLFPDRRGQPRPVAAGGEGAAWLAPSGALGRLLRGLPGERCVPLVADDLAAGLGWYLEDLGARTLDLLALLGLLDAGAVVLARGEIRELHRYLDAISADLPPRWGAALGRAAIFPDLRDHLRPLVGEEATLLPADEAIETLAPEAPWLAADLREASHLARLPVARIGPRAVLDELAGEGGGRLLVDRTDPASLRRAYGYLVAKADALEPGEGRALVDAPIWLDVDGSPRPLGALRRPPEDPDLAELFALLGGEAAIETEGEPSAAEVVDVLGLSDALAIADHRALIAALAHAEAEALLGGSARDTLVRALRGAVRLLDADELKPLARAPIFEVDDGRHLPPGDWAEETREAAHRARGAIRAALSGGSRPLLTVPDERDFGQVLDALGRAPADATTLLDALGGDAALAGPEARAAGRRALVAEAEALGALPEELGVAERLSELPLWPAEGGGLRAARELVRPSVLREVFGAAHAEQVVAGTEETLLAEEADVVADVEALTGLLRFRSPVDLVLDALETLARPDEPVDAQPALLADRGRLALMARLVAGARGEDTAWRLPLGVDADGRLVSGRLWELDEDAFEATVGLAELRPRVAEPAWARAMETVDPEWLPALPAQRLLAELARVTREAERPADVEALATAPRRAALYRWLAGHGAEIAGDEQARSTLGNARLLTSEAGSLLAPREALLGEGALAGLDAEALGLGRWLPSDEVPRGLREWMHRLYAVERGRRKQVTGLLVDAYREALASGELERSLTILGSMARLWPEEAEQPADEGPAGEVFEWTVKNHKLRRLKVETATGELEQVSRVHAPTAEQRGLLEAFLVEPPACTSDRYAEEPIRGFLHRLGAKAALDAKALRELLAGGAETLRAGLEATLALARYVASVVGDDPEAADALRLDALAWIPDGTGRRRRAADLYWPDPDVEALVGPRPELYPHPELFYTVPEALAARLPFRRAGDARAEDVLADLERGGGALPTRALLWFEERLRAGDLEAGAVRRAFGDAAVLRDDGGALRASGELITVPARDWIGEHLHLWSDGARYPELARALGIPLRVGAREVGAYLGALRERWAAVGGAALLAEDPELGARLPRCLALLAARGAPRETPLVLACRGADERLGMCDGADPTLVLPEPEWLVGIARAAGVPLKLPVLPPDDEEEARALRWLAGLGVVPLSALLGGEKASRRSEADVTPAYARHVRELTRGLERACRVPGLGRLLGGGAPRVRVVEDLWVDARLAGSPVRFRRDALYDAGERLLVVSPDGAAEPRVAAEAVVRAASEIPRTERAPWVAALVDAMAGRDATAPEKEPEVPAPRSTAPAPAPPARPAREEKPPAEPGAGLWSRISRWLTEPPEPSPEPAEAPTSERLPSADHGRWFQPRDAIESQLHDAAGWLRDRTVAPEFGFAFAPRSLPFPHRYAHQALCGRLDPRTQRWLPTRVEPEWLEPAERGRFRVALRGRVPRGESLFPLPLYGRLLEAEGPDVRILRGRRGRVLLAAKRPVELDCLVELDRAPEFEGVDAEPADVDALLEATVGDEELPDEAIERAETLRAADMALLDKALAVRIFVRERYVYDPSYLEDPAVAQWLRKLTRGRRNVHLAALHAGADSEHLGRGVCYELGAMACELLRRAGIPAAVASGWTWEAGQLGDPDHLWAMALLPTAEGHRWLPIDPSTTREGRPLRVGRRPPGPWTVRKPRQEEPEPPPQPRWETPAPSRLSGPAAAPAAGSGSGQSKRPGRSKRAPRPPIGELMRAVTHAARLSGEEVDGPELFRRCRALLDDPDEARRLVELLRGD